MYMSDHACSTLYKKNKKNGDKRKYMHHAFHFHFSLSLSLSLSPTYFILITNAKY